MTILLVEDDAIVAYAITFHLEQIGYKVVKHIIHGEEVAGFVKSNKVDVILLDINLANDVSGIDAAKEVRKFDQLPIIFISGQNLQYASEIEKIANTFRIDKPISLPKLGDLLGELS